MTYEQLIEKLKSAMSIDQFAYDEIPFDANFSDKAIEAQKQHDAWLKEDPNPGWGKEGYEEWQKRYKLMPNKYKIAEEEYLEKHGIPTWKEIDQYGGEGNGKTWYSVKYFPSLDMYIRVDGYYQSYSGTSFDGWESCKQVKPTEKTITVYE